ncbi:MAG: hypothetical protein ACLPWD_03450 [Methanobacterium sp.]
MIFNQKKFEQLLNLLLQKDIASYNLEDFYRYAREYQKLAVTKYNFLIKDDENLHILEVD